MPAPKGPVTGIADDAGDYEDLAKPAAAAVPRPRDKGIAEDAKLFEDIVSESTDEARTLESDWTYQQNGQVFGPVKPRVLLELLYNGQIDAKTPIAVSDGEFAPLERYGVFRVHLPKVERHQQELAEIKAEEHAAARTRLRRRLGWAAIALGLAVASGYGLYSYVKKLREEAALAESKAKEAALLGELDALMANVTVEPPLMELVEDKEPEQPGARRRTRRAVARFSAPAAGTGELTREEIMSGIAKVFPGFKRCIVEQIQREPDSVPEQLVLGFSIDNDGSVRGVTVSERSLRGSPLATCMARNMGEVRFRKYKGEVQSVEYPISIGRR